VNPLQMALQIRHELQTVAWPGGGDYVFGSSGVVVVGGTPTEEQIPAGFPWAMVIIGTGTADPDAPDLIEQQFTVVTAVEVAGDPHGEFAIIGGARASLLASAGAGVGEVAARTRAAIEDLTGADGATILLSTSNTGSTATLGRGKHLAMDELNLTAVCTSAPYYAPPQQFVRSGGTWTWTGGQCSSRFDFVQYRMGYVAGTTPPDTPDDLDTVVYTGTSTTTTHTALPSKIYAVFADYNLRGGSTVAGSSNGSDVGAYLKT